METFLALALFRIGRQDSETLQVLVLRENVSSISAISDWMTRFGNSSDTFVKTVRVLALFLIGRQESPAVRKLSRKRSE